MGFVSNQRSIYVGRFNVAIGADDEFDDDAEAVLVLEERSNTGRKLLGQHGEVSNPRVHGGCFAGGVLIDWSHFRYEGIDIGDPHHDFDIAIGCTLHDLNLIEVARGIVVDGGPQEVAHVADIARRRGLQLLPEIRELRGDRRRKIGLEPVLLHDFFGCSL